MADFTVKVTAQVQQALEQLKRVNKEANKTTEERKIKFDFSEVKTQVQDAANNIKSFYKIARQAPGIGGTIKDYEELASNTVSVAKAGVKSASVIRQNADALTLLGNTAKATSSAFGSLVTNLAKIGFATFAVKETVGVLQAAWNGFFQNTIGREIQLRETILKTQTTLASTSKVFKNGREITEPYEKIVTLTGAVQDRIDSIRERSIALAGVTSNEVIEVFGIVSAQVGAIGAGLKEAEDLAINFSAALGTFGIPLYQARQEIGSILRGDITQDSYLAKSLGITNEDIDKAKSEAGGVIAFLEERLEAAVAGQRIAAQGFAGVVSNIADLGELISQNFGRGLLDPLLTGLTAVFESLFAIRKEIFEIASKAGETVGRVGTLVVGITQRRTGIGQNADAAAAAENASTLATNAFTEVEKIAQRFAGALSRALLALTPVIKTLVGSFANLAEVIIKIKVAQFENLVGILSNMAVVLGQAAQPLAAIFYQYSQLLKLPLVQYFAELSSTLSVLKRLGLDTAIQIVLGIRLVITTLGPLGATITALLASIVGGIAVVIAALAKLTLALAGIALAMAKPVIVGKAAAAAFTQLAAALQATGTSAGKAAAGLTAVKAGLLNATSSAKKFGATLLIGLGKLVLLQIAIAALVNLFLKFQQQQENDRASKRAALALERLQTTYKDVGDEADYATKAARDFERQVVQTRFNSVIQEVDKLKQKIKDLREEQEKFAKFESNQGAVRGLRKLLTGTEKSLGQSLIEGTISDATKELADLQAEAQKIGAVLDAEKAEDDIKTAARDRKENEEQIARFRRDLERSLASERLSVQSKEIEVFRAAGQERIAQMDRANQKLIEGERGRARTALENLVKWVSNKKKGELDIQAAERQFALEQARLEQTVADYRYGLEEKIKKLRVDGANAETAAAEARLRLEKARQTAGLAVGPSAPSGVVGRVGSTGDSTGPHLDIRWADGRPISRADADKYFRLDGKKPTDFPVTSEYGPRKLFGRSFHAGIDFGAPSGTPISLTGGATFSRNLGDTGAGGYAFEVMTPEGAMKALHALKGSVIPTPTSGPAAPATTPTPAATPTPADTSAPAAGVPSASAAAAEKRRIGQTLIDLDRSLEDLRRKAAEATSAEELVAAVKSGLIDVKGLVETARTDLSSSISTLEEFSKIDGPFDIEDVRITSELSSITKELERTQTILISKLSEMEDIDDSDRITAIKEVRKQTQGEIKDLKNLEVQRRLSATAAGLVSALPEARRSEQRLQQQQTDIQTSTNLRDQGYKPEEIALELQIVSIRRDQAAALEPLNTNLAKAKELLAASNGENREAAATVTNLEERIQDLNLSYANQIELLRAIAEAQSATSENTLTLRSAYLGTLEGFRAWETSVGTLRSRITDFTQNAIGGLSNSLSELLTTGTTNFREFTASLLADMSKLVLETMVLLPLMNRLTSAMSSGLRSPAPSAGGGGGGVFDLLGQGLGFITPALFAKGGVMTKNGPLPLNFYSGGGVASSPQLAVFGEGSNPEAFVPLPNGRSIPVEFNDPNRAGTGSNGNVVVNVQVDANDSEVSGSSDKGKKLGRAVATAVQDEILKQKRPGGLLNE